MFVFKDMDDYKANGRDADTEYSKIITARKKNSRKTSIPTVPAAVKLEQNKLTIPTDVVGKQVKHKSFGTGMITAIEGACIVVNFDAVGIKKMEYELCIKKKLLEFFYEGLDI